MPWVVIVVLAWLTLFLVALAAAAGRRRMGAEAADAAPPWAAPPADSAPPAGAPPTGAPAGAATAAAAGWLTARRVPWLLVALALVVVAVRAPLAATRPVRNVDEAQYAATAAFCAWSGESVFGSPRNIGAHQLLYHAGSLERPYRVVDVATSCAVGLTGLLLGLTFLRAGADPRAALLVVPAYALLLLRFEGLSSNKEPWVNLCLAAWALVRLGRPPDAPPTSWARQLCAGACLGAAAAMKEQALPLLLCEPLLELLDRLRAAEAPAERVRRFLAHEALAALGFWVPLALFLGAYAAQGQLGAYVSFVLEMAGTSARASQDLARLLELPGPPAAADVAEPTPLALGLADAALRYALGPVGLLGCVGALSLLVEASELRDRARRPAVGMFLLAVLGFAAASIGRRWFGHYLMLGCVGLAGLGVWRLLRALDERRAAPTRAAASVLLVLAALVALQAAVVLWRVPEVAQGAGLEARELEELEELGRGLDRFLPPGERILVWGWRPEVYLATRRAPALRYVGGLTARKQEVLADLARYGPPAAVVLPGERGLGPLRYADEAGEERVYDPYQLERHPRLLEALRRAGYVALPPFKGYTVLLRLDLKRR